MKLLLTGSTGFIGSHLVRNLTDKYDVVCLIPPSAIGRRTLPENVKIEFADLTHHDAIKSLVIKHNPEIIMHLGAITPVGYSFQFPDIYQSVNYLATQNLVQSALHLESFKKFIFPSTIEVYGLQKEKKPFTENIPQAPMSPYAISKQSSENYIKLMGKTRQFPHTILRFASTYGRKIQTNFVVEYLVIQMLKGKSPHVGTPDVVKDFMYVDDHVDSYLRVLEFEIGSPDKIKQNMESDINYYVFNIGTGLELTIKDVVNKIKELTGFNGDIQMGYPSSYPSRAMVEPYLSLDATKAKKILNWKPKFDLEEGLRNVISFWKENL